MIQVSVRKDTPEAKKFDAIARDLHETGHSEVACTALGLLAWAIEEVKAGRELASYNEHEEKLHFFSTSWVDHLTKERDKQASLGPRTPKDEATPTDLNKFRTSKNITERPHVEGSAIVPSVTNIKNKQDVNYGIGPRDQLSHVKVFCEGDHDDRRLDAMGKDTGIDNRASVVMTAVGLLKWAVDEVKSGKMLTSYDNKTEQLHFFATEKLDQVAIENEQKREMQMEREQSRPANVTTSADMNRAWARKKIPSRRIGLDIGPTATITELKPRKSTEPSSGGPER